MVMSRTEEKLSLELNLVLPEENGQCPRCAERLGEALSGQRGIEKAHLRQEGERTLLCLHYDPNLASLKTVKKLAEEAGSLISERYRHETLRVRGMDCTDCAKSLEHILSRHPGVIDVSASYAAERMRVEYDSAEISHKEIVRRVEWMGYKVEEGKKEGRFQSNRELVFALLAGLFLAAGFLAERSAAFSTQTVTGIYLLSYLAGGYDATRHAVKAAVHARFDIDFLMVVAALGAALVGQEAEGALLLFLFSLGHSLEHFAMGRARKAIEALGEISPKTARVVREGREMELSADELERGDVVIVRPGERIPIDGLVLMGISSVDQSPITGESLPQDKSPGDPVYAGTVNGEGSLEIEVTKLSRDSTLARVVQMVEDAQVQKSPTQRFTERIERTFVPLVLAGVVLLIVVPPVAGLLPLEVAFIRAMTILVAASPCALAISTPSAVLSGIAQAARHGVLIKGGVHLENLGSVKAIAFDKTGTLTLGRPEVTDAIPAGGTDEDDLLKIAGAAESRSGHPLAEAVLRAARNRGLDLPAAGDLQSIPGMGVKADLGGEEVLIGNLKLFEGDEADTDPLFEAILSEAENLEEQGKTTMVVRKSGRFLGVIGFSDRPRPEAASALKRLKDLGIESLVMITGDNERVASAVAAEVGVTEQISSLLPEEKVSAVEDLLRKYSSVAMVGDGVNDAPALVQATVGIAMGAGGTDVALETADVALMSDDLSRLPFAVALSRKSRKIIRQNLAIALGVIALLIPLALSGLAGIGLAIVLHEGSTLLVVANALRLLRFRPE